ncbi:MAG: prepilin-type N-terminal cleavage/methylation domain-containing protein [Kiritimatiellia bacterium]
MKTQRTKKTGFTLIEMLVVIAIIALLAAILVPAVTKALESANATKLVANGSSIYKSVFAQIADVQAELYGGSSVALPRTDDNLGAVFNMGSSNEYFVYLVTNDILSVNWSFFGGSRIPTAPGKAEETSPGVWDVTDFRVNNNAWSVIADLSVDDSGTPFLITRNLGGTTDLTSTTGSINQLDDSASTTRLDQSGDIVGPPYDDRRLVIIRIGGSGETMKDQNITWRNINPGKADNDILRPGNL